MGCWKKFWPLVPGCVLRTAGSSIIWNYADPLTSLELLNQWCGSGLIICGSRSTKCDECYFFKFRLEKNQFLRKKVYVKPCFSLKFILQAFFDIKPRKRLWRLCLGRYQQLWSGIENVKKKNSHHFWENREENPKKLESKKNLSRIFWLNAQS